MLTTVALILFYDSNRFLFDVILCWAAFVAWWSLDIFY